MDRKQFEEILNALFEWQLSTHSVVTAPKKKSKRFVKKLSELHDDFEDEEIEEDEEQYIDRHKDTTYPVVFIKKPVKTTCNLCENEVFDQVFNIKIKERSCVRKCSICKKTEEIKLKKMKINK